MLCQCGKIRFAVRLVGRGHSISVRLGWRLKRPGAVIFAPVPSDYLSSSGRSTAWKIRRTQIRSVMVV